MSYLLGGIGLYSLLPNYISSRKINIKSSYSLNSDGFEIFNFGDAVTVNIVHKEILQRLPENYVFLDYEYKIVNSTLYTFHRDVTSSQSFQKLKYPSFTLIIYYSDGKLLSICPNSHKQRFFISWPVIVCGKAGTCILFNSDCVHAGAMNKTSERIAVQYKICHKEDVILLQHLNNQNIIKKR